MNPSTKTATPTATPRATAKPTATPKVTAKPTATPNMYVRVTAAPNGTYFTLEKGMMGEPVKKLQQALKSAGYYSGTCDGYYGDATVKAVKNYQRAKGLVQDGKAGHPALPVRGRFPRSGVIAYFQRQRFNFYYLAGVF